MVPTQPSNPTALGAKPHSSSIWMEKWSRNFWFGSSSTNFSRGTDSRSKHSRRISVRFTTNFDHNIRVWQQFGRESISRTKLVGCDSIQYSLPSWNHLALSYRAANSYGPNLQQNCIVSTSTNTNFPPTLMNTWEAPSDYFYHSSKFPFQYSVGVLKWKFAAVLKK